MNPFPYCYITRSPEMTELVGEHLGAAMKGGEVIAFLGNMGAGKTAFVRGLARGMDIDAQVTSPTYTIVNEYEGRLPLFHFDMYRLSGEDDLFDIGWEDYLVRGGVCAVEWSENILPALENGYIEVDIALHPDNEDWRIIKIREMGAATSTLQLSLDLF